MKKASIIVLVVIILMVTMAVTGGGCGEADEAELPTYSEGDQWEYKFAQDSIEYTLTQEVTGEEVVDSTDCYTMDWSFDPPMEGISTMEYSVDKETLCSFMKMESSYDYQGQPVIWASTYSYDFLEGAYWPLKVGNEFTMEETATTTVTVNEEVMSSETTTTTYIGEVEKKEEIEVPAGEFDCFKMVTTDEDGNLTSVTWYSDEVKSEVKNISYDDDGNVTRSMELNSYSV